jgi:hypothetical protein
VTVSRNKERKERKKNNRVNNIEICHICDILKYSIFRNSETPWGKVKED